MTEVSTQFALYYVVDEDSNWQLPAFNHFFSLHANNVYILIFIHLHAFDVDFGDYSLPQVVRYCSGVSSVVGEIRETQKKTK